MRSIYDDDEFVRCVIREAKTEENWGTMLAFVEKASELGDPVTYEDMVALSLVLRERSDKAQHDLNGDSSGTR